MIMVQGGPFGDDDKTVLRPMPGGRSPDVGASRPAAQIQPPLNIQAPVNLIEALPFRQSGSLVDLAAGLLSLASRLKQTVSYPAVDELKQKLGKEVREFENRTLAAGIPTEQGRMASYCLCTFLDEIIQNTPWGSQSNWGHQSLLIVFHKEAWGGERFFQIVDYLVKQPAQSLSLLEFCYVLMSFGFEGKYRVIPNGLNDIERQRLELYQLIQRVRGDFEPELSPRWRGQNTGKSNLMKQVPLWIFGAVAAGLLILCYLGFAYWINSTSDPVYRDLLTLTAAPAQTTVDTSAAQSAQTQVKAVPRLERFKPLLKDEIAANMVEVVDDSVIRVRNSFPSGSDQVKPEFLPMLKKIAKELENGQESILVTGHTDDKPIVSAKFPSNWSLSTARAKNVLTILQQSAQLAGTARAEGRADGEPLEPNDSPEHRSFNRRVDILVK
ncbi:type IVB secretion system protein IcmH/DotU [Methylomonas sp. LWB]|uniref:type IVB secretion system protein IcmH/DotU n=1 Tax=Methylomonas sp. LWB TaxID=1905845 RepID=UPI0034A0E295